MSATNSGCVRKLLTNQLTPSMCASLQLEPSSWDPFVDIVMYHMYHDALPEGLSHGQLLEAARLADRLQVGAISSVACTHSLRFTCCCCSCMLHIDVHLHSQQLCTAAATCSACSTPAVPDAGCSSVHYGKNSYNGAACGHPDSLSVLCCCWYAGAYMPQKLQRAAAGHCCRRLGLGRRARLLQHA